MPYSMTGFGNAEYSKDGITIRVSIKSLNSRFLDIHLKLPRLLYEFESNINTLVKKYLERGRVSISMEIESESDSDLLDEINLDVPRLKQYIGLIDDISSEIQNINKPNIEYFLNNQEIVKKETKLNKEQIEICLKKSLILGLQETQKLRKIEGLKLSEDLALRIDISNQIIEEIKTVTDSNWNIQIEKYKKRISSLIDDVKIDEQRLVQEIAIIAEKRDITEEITRFNAHTELFKDFLNESSNQIGKKMNFLLQEIGREVNTIGSKTDITKVSHLVVNLKNEIEKIREQVQNIL
jgi:uncharacterized protein (TIGR00255 family)